jgi:GAF domain-containing protein
MSPAPDSTLADPQQVITDLKRELAQSRAERDEALAREIAIADVLQVINSSPGDLAPVFEAMVDKATNLCEAACGHLLIYDGQHVTPAAVRGGSEYLEYMRSVGLVSPGIDTPVGRALRGEAVVHIIDAREEEIYRSNEGFREQADMGRFRSMLVVGLRREDTFLGTLTVFREEVRPFTDKHIALLQNFAAQAVIAIDNARLINETREALKQQTATAEVLGVINSSPGDLAPVFEAMLEKATRLCEADAGVFCSYDGECFLPAAWRGFDQFPREPITPHPETGIGRLARGENTVHILDSASGAAYDSADPGRRAIVQLGGARSQLCAALRKDGTLLGSFTIWRREVRPFSDRQIALLQNFAAQAVIAMENARLITEIREALEQQTATSEVLQVINASPGDLQPVFDAVLDKALRLCEASFGFLMTYDGAALYSAADRGHPEFAARIRGLGRIEPEAGTANARIIEGESVIHIIDAANDPNHQGDSTVRRAVVEIGGFRTLLSVALRKDDALLGIIHIFRQQVRPFSDKQIALLQSFAAQAVIAMENARLINETREALEQQTATAEVLGVINASPGDLAPVFDAILEKAMRLCGISFGTLQLNESGKFRAVAVRGMADDLADLLRQPLDPLPGTPPARLLAGERLVHVIDMAEFTERNRANPRGQAVAANNLHTVLFVPLRKDAALLGYIAAFRKQVQAFSEKEIALLENFAAQAVIAMENARLLTETREALEQQTATAEVLGVINSSPGDLTPVFDAMLEKALRLCEASFGTLSTYEGGHIHTLASRRVPSALANFLSKPRPPAPGGRWDQIIQGENLLHIADLAADPAESNLTRRAFVESGRARSMLWTALRKEEKLLGILSIYRQEVRPFTDKQIALLQNFAAQAVIAMENARLITETREALEQQTATAEVLGVINSSPGELAPVFDAILEKAHSLCGIAFGSLNLYEAGKIRAVAVRAVAEDLADLLRQPMEPLPGSRISRLLAGERFVQITDVVETAKQFPDDSRLQLTAARGMRTGLLVPLRKEADFLGYISGFRAEVRPFSEKEIALLESFAAQAVIAMENARLLGELRQRTEEVAELNRGLEARVAEQVEELGRVGRLKRFLAPQLAELIVSQGDEKILESHRREIVVVFCDLRGYTAFTETAEPEEVLDFLREYHGALGPLVSQFEGTLDQFSGDGIMVFFNDPVPIPDPAERAVKMAMAMREAAAELIAAWRRRGRMLGFGAGIAQGYATLGQIGFADRSGYTAIGTVCNLAARLCAEAKDGQILIAQRVAVATEKITALEEVGELSLKGLTQPVVAFNVPLAANQPALRVIEGGPERA